MSEDRATVESPCIKTCLIQPEVRLCIGCLRTMDEIARWGGMSPEDRRAVMAALPSRAPILARARGEGPTSKKVRG